MDYHVQPTKIVGCLLGGAVGDALGAPVEFDSLDAIRERFGPEGIIDLTPAYGRVGAITDDTQMALFTAEGLVRAQVRYRERGICHVPSVVHHAYLRWLHTQTEASSHALFFDKLDGWLIGVEQLHSRRAPGNSCLSALRSDKMGTIDEPINNSKGCGGVLLAVNHSGDSDSTGAITGNILGTALGSMAVPARWLGQLELRDVIGQGAAELVRHFHTDGFELTDQDRDRYPGW